MIGKLVSEPGSSTYWEPRTPKSATRTEEGPHTQVTRRVADVLGVRSTGVEAVMVQGKVVRYGVDRVLGVPSQSRPVQGGDAETTGLYRVSALVVDRGSSGGDPPLYDIPFTVSDKPRAGSLSFNSVRKSQTKINRETGSVRRE